jgi:chemotaxis protein histidine kinase CheA
VTLTFRQRGDRLSVSVEDDGAGVDVAAVRERLGPDAAGMTDHDICQAVLAPGLSTREETTEISGRGIGLGAVAKVSEELRGHVTVESWPGRGTRVSLDLPLNLSLIQGVLVVAGGSSVILPEYGLTGLGDHVDDAVSLAEILGLPSESPPLQVVLLRGQEREIPIAVDEVVGPVEVVRRGIGMHLGRVRFIQGATIMDHGKTALILNLLEVCDACEGRTIPAAGLRHRILVVDDSATVLASLSSTLRRAGFDVATAENGEIALDLLDEADFDAVVSDVQMPRMSGFDLLERCAARLPMILATSFPSEEGESRARQLGALDYLAKDDAVGDAVVKILLRHLPSCVRPRS